jgi:small subunit ribosomal protein S20
LANIKSQIKRNRQNEKRRLRNRNFRGAARTAVNQARLAMDTGSPDAQTALKYAISLLDQAAERGVIHPNNAARRKGRLMRHLAALSAQPAVMHVEEQNMTVAATLTEEEAAKPKKKASAKKIAAKETTAKKTAAKKSASRKSAKK